MKITNKERKILEDYNELSLTIKGVNNLNSLVELISDSNKYSITNDLRETDGLIDINYKSICATIKQSGKDLIVLPEIEIWDNNGGLEFLPINIISYSQYRTTIKEDGTIWVNFISPYDEQDYYYMVGDRIYRDGRFVQQMEKSDDEINEIDKAILTLMKLNSTLNSKMCYN